MVMAEMSLERDWGGAVGRPRQRTRTSLAGVLPTGKGTCTFILPLCFGEAALRCIVGGAGTSWIR